MTGVSKGMPRSEVLRRAVGVVAGLVAFGSVGVVAVPAAASQMSVRAKATEYFTWPAGTASVGILVDEIPDSVQTVVVGRERAPQVYLTRNCLVASPIRIDVPQGQGKSAWAHVSAPASWHHCTTTLTWQIPPQVATDLRVGLTQEQGWGEQQPSADQRHIEEYTDSLRQAEVDRVTQESRRAELEKLLASKEGSADERGEWAGELADLKNSLAQNTADRAEARRVLDQLKWEHDQSLQRSN